MNKLIELDNKEVNSIDVDKIVKTVKRLEEIINSIEVTINDEPVNENFIEGSKVINLNDKS